MFAISLQGVVAKMVYAISKPLEFDTFKMKTIKHPDSAKKVDTEKYIQIFDFDLPHYTGLVFKVKGETKGYFLVEDIFSSIDGKRLNSDGYNKNICLEIDGSQDYLDLLIERTRLILEFQFNK